MCEWQVKLCDPLVTHGPYMSALAVVLPVIRRYTNHQITLTLTLDCEMDGRTDILVANAVLTLCCAAKKGHQPANYWVHCPSAVKVRGIFPFP